MDAGSPIPKENTTQTSNVLKTSATARKIRQATNIIDYSDFFPAKPGKFPYVVAVKVRNNGASCIETSLCTGVLYDHNFVLTAGI